jgi:hypothetical protein
MKNLSARRITRHFFGCPGRFLIAAVQSDLQVLRTWSAIRAELKAIQRRERAAKIGAKV